MILTTILTVSVEEIKEQAKGIYNSLALFQSDSVSTDYKVDIVGYNNLNQAHSAAREKRSGAMGMANSIANNLTMLVDTITAADEAMISG